MRNIYYVIKVISFMTAFLFLFGIQKPFAQQDGGYNITAELWVKAVLNVPGNSLTLIWQEAGNAITPSGDKVVSGYFYADPNTFAYGNQYNPELFVKIYITTAGWCNIAFNHVTVDPVTIQSAHNYKGVSQKAGTATTTSRILEHQYTNVRIDAEDSSNDNDDKPFNQLMTEKLLGTWDIYYTISSTIFKSAFNVTGPAFESNTLGEYIVNGVNEWGEPIVAGYICGTDFFALLDNNHPEYFERHFVFSFDSLNAVSGCFFAAQDGDSGDCYQMYGYKTSSESEFLRLNVTQKKVFDLNAEELNSESNTISSMNAEQTAIDQAAMGAYLRLKNELEKRNETTKRSRLR